MGFRIVATGSAVPEFILTNGDLRGMVDTSDEWITTRVGVETRHIATVETTASLAADAARRALDAAGIGADDVRDLTEVFCVGQGAPAEFYNDRFHFCFFVSFFIISYPKRSNHPESRGGRRRSSRRRAA